MSGDKIKTLVALTSTLANVLCRSSCDHAGQHKGQKEKILSHCLMNLSSVNANVLTKTFNVIV